MSGAGLLAGAHRFVASNSTFNEAKTVSGMFAKVSIKEADGAGSLTDQQHPQQLWQ